MINRISGFFLDYYDILTAHPDTRDRMLYGLHRIGELINDGVNLDPAYFLKCSNFEPFLEMLYQGLTVFRNIMKKFL